MVDKNGTRSWESLISELHRIFASDNVNVDEVKEVLYSYKSDPKDWKKYALFDPCGYTRNLVDNRNGRFNLMILCWGEGQGSSIHDHSNAHCFVKQLQGSLTESLYAWPDKEINKRSEENNGEQAMKLLKESSVNVDDVSYICDQIGLHRVSNPSHLQGAISLHLYCPPFQTGNVFDARTGHKAAVTMTLWSVCGKRCCKLETADAGSISLIGNSK